MFSEDVPNTEGWRGWRLLVTWAAIFLFCIIGWIGVVFGLREVVRYVLFG